MNTHPRRPAEKAASPTLSATEVALVIFVLIVLTIAVVIGSRTSAPQLDETMKVKVHAGDTWWTLAEQYPVDGATTAQLADHLAEVNLLGKGQLVVGKAVIVPAEQTRSTAVAMLSTFADEQTR